MIEIDTLEPRMTTASADTTAIADQVDTKNPEWGPLLITTGAS